MSWEGGRLAATSRCRPQGQPWLPVLGCPDRAHRTIPPPAGLSCQHRAKQVLGLALERIKDFGSWGSCHTALLPSHRKPLGTADLRVQSLQVLKITTWWASGKKDHHPQTMRKGPANSNKGQFSALKTKHLTQQGKHHAPHS